MKNKNLSFVLIIIALINFTTYAKLTNDTLCVDCRPESKTRCKIESETGYSCKHWTKKSENKLISILDFLEGEKTTSTACPTKGPTPKPEVTTDLDVCLPPDLNFTETGFKVCCVWSPALGCQVLISSNYTSRYCLQCRHGVGDGLEPCPCVSISAKRYCRTLDAAIAAYTVFLMIYI
ncbi:uncharacterized protein LOC119554763 [Drosophila subpulchrella]|uniref:uncharacterized protein LOC119554763 n=1 Tax=Drosophila subpulchrella TaxID=1486046 RepID=UPI0018A12A0E|nr:uncharacterized protein LOC119554763 [Drosophila subpulchrella]